MKRATTVILTAGFLIVAVAIVLAAIEINSVDVIGGADFPSFWFHLKQYIWMICGGLLLIVTSICFRITKRK